LFAPQPASKYKRKQHDAQAGRPGRFN